jgi:hypothetical protein
MVLEVEVDHQVLLHLQWQEATEVFMVLVAAVAVAVADLHLAKVGMVRMGLLLSQLIFNMSEQYAIINTEGGWLEFLTDWDKDLYPLWEPLPHCYAVLASEIDLSTLPQKPE